MSVNPSTPVHLYQGIVDDLREMIRTGRLAAGDQVPPLGKLAERYGVSVITTKRAVAELQAQGLVHSVRGKGTFVARQTTPAPRKRGLSARQTPLRTVTLMTINADVRNTRSFIAQIWDAVEQHAEALGLQFNVQVIPDGGSPFHVDLSVRPDPSNGLIFFAPSYPYRMLHLFEDRQFRGVMVDSALSFAHSVLTDNFAGIAQLLAHLNELGHRRVLLATRDPYSPNPTNENEREAAFHFFTRQLEIVAEVVHGQTGEELLRSIENHRATAVMFTQDGPAARFQEFAQQRGVKVPQQLSVSGFDGWINHQDPRQDLTTLVVDRAGLGQAAVNLLAQVARDGVTLPRWVRVPGQLRIGSTTSTAR